MWGSWGSGDGQFISPAGVAVDSSGNVYVADTGNHRIQKFTSDGHFVTKCGVEGSGDGQFRNPADVAVDSSGNVYVADTGNHRIQKFEQPAAMAAPRVFRLQSDHTWVEFRLPAGAQGQVIRDPCRCLQ